MITDASSNILLVNRRFTEITGYAQEEVIGKSPKILNSGQQDDSFYGNMWRALMNRGDWHGEIRNRRKDGEVIVEWLNISAVKNELDKVSNYVGIFTEITVHKKLKKRMQYLAHYDVLTALPNRVLFSDRLEQSIISAKRNSCMTALLFIDLDHFDTINKNMGHAAGDMILQEVSARLLGEIPEGCSVSRLGSDEFAVVLVDVRSNEEPANTAVRLLQTLNRSMFVGENELNVSASIGISLFPADGTDSEMLTKSAETAMYQAVEAGGNTYRVFNPPEKDALSDRQKLRDRLFRAMDRDEFRVFYQPLISSTNGRIVGAEALLRWFRPETGYVSPQTFVPLMEESGLVLKVGDWVLRNAMADCAKWRKTFGVDLTVTVNLSQVEFGDPHCVERVESALKELAFDPSYLQIELSENTVMRDAPSALSRLHQFSELGVRLSIDNFGTGYSSVSYLHRFPIHSIKMDRSFVFDTPNDAEAVAVVRAIGAMGQSLQLEMTAEGVETAAQVDFLRSVGCDTFQGYRFAEALSSEAFTKLLASKKRFDFLVDDRDMPEHLHLVR
jgi:diguanylate cyclase (GGDEF)-like protein/PAS domain S-box-containing protein